MYNFCFQTLYLTLYINWKFKIWMVNLWDFSTRAREIRILFKFHCSRDICQPLCILPCNKKPTILKKTEVINNIYTCKTCILISRCQKTKPRTCITGGSFPPHLAPFLTISCYPITFPRYSTIYATFVFTVYTIYTMRTGCKMNDGHFLRLST